MPPRNCANCPACPNTKALLAPSPTRLLYFSGVEPVYICCGWLPFKQYFGAEGDSVMTNILNGRTKWIGLALPVIVVTFVSFFSLLNAVMTAAVDSEPGDWLYNLQQPALQLQELSLNRTSRGRQPEAQNIDASYEVPAASGEAGLTRANPSPFPEPTATPAPNVTATAETGIPVVIYPTASGPLSTDLVATTEPVPVINNSPVGGDTDDRDDGDDRDDDDDDRDDDNDDRDTNDDDNDNRDSDDGDDRDDDDDDRDDDNDDRDTDDDDNDNRDSDDGDDRDDDNDDRDRDDDDDGD
jgi:hypothetical protein